jgi:hypothetical protein
MSFHNELALKNLYVEKNIVARGGLVVNDIYSTAIHAPSMETQELFVKGIAHVSELAIQSEVGSLPRGGIQSNGDFLLTAVTAQPEAWVSPIPNNHLVVSGNRIGQICSVFVEVTSNDPVPDGSVLFSSVPDDFWPFTKTICPVSIWDGSTFLSAVVMFDPESKQIRFYGTWSAQSTLTATLNYFRVQDQT